MPPRFGTESSQRHTPRRGRTGFESELRRVEQLCALRSAVCASVTLPEVSVAHSRAQSRRSQKRALAVVEDAIGCGNLLF